MLEADIEIDIGFVEAHRQLLHARHEALLKLLLGRGQRLIVEILDRRIARRVVKAAHRPVLPENRHRSAPHILRADAQTRRQQLGQQNALLALVGKPRAGRQRAVNAGNGRLGRRQAHQRQQRGLLSAALDWDIARLRKAQREPVARHHSSVFVEVRQDIIVNRILPPPPLYIVEERAMIGWLPLLVEADIADLRLEGGKR